MSRGSEELFIREQMGKFRELREEFIDDEVLDRHVWSPVSCRWCCWTFKPNPHGRLVGTIFYRPETWQELTFTGWKASDCVY